MGRFPLFNRGGAELRPADTEPPTRNTVGYFCRTSRLGGLAFLLVLTTVSPALAQKVVDSTQTTLLNPFEFRTTLEGWAEDRRLFVLDRKHNFGGRLYDRGIFRHITPETNREYAHEMLVQRFPSQAFARRRRAQNSLLARVGSVRRDLLAFVTRIQSRVPLDTAQKLTIDAVLQQDGRATRSFLEVGYTWQFAAHHALGVRHTFSEYKRDLDPTILYRYSNGRLGSAELGFTLQDLYSDLLDQQLGIDPSDLDVIRDYVRHPYLLSFSYRSPDHLPLRGELFGAIQPMSRAVYQSQKRPEYRYRDDRRLHFFGALLEYRFPSFAGGLFYKRDVSWLRRVGMGGEVSSDYTARQRFQRLGTFLKGRWGPFRGMVQGFVGSYRDRQRGDDYSESVLPQRIDYDEEQQGVQAQVFYEPGRTGMVAGLEYVALRREYDGENDPTRVGNNFVFAPWAKQYWGFGPSDYGLVGRVGYRFSRGRVVFGVGYDIDADDDFPADHTEKEKTRRFDGAFGRLVLTW